MRWVIAAIVLLSGTAGIATEKIHSNPRLVIEAYVDAALAGKVDDAVSLGLPDRAASDQTQVIELYKLIDAPTVKIPAVWVSVKNGHAIAVTEQVTIKEPDLDKPESGYFVFSLEKLEDRWLVDDIDYDSEIEANEQVEEFKKANLDAESLPVALLAPNVSADAEAATTLLRVTGGHIEIAMTPEHAKAMQQRGESAGGMLVNCKSVKLTINDEGNVFECQGCSFTTSAGIKGRAQCVVFDLAKGTVTLSGDDFTPVELLTNLTGQNVEQKLVAGSILMTLPPDRPKLIGVPVQADSRFFQAETLPDPKPKAKGADDSDVRPTGKLETPPPSKQKP
jgi:hypothetical protein